MFSALPSSAVSSKTIQDDLHLAKLPLYETQTLSYRLISRTSFGSCGDLKVEITRFNDKNETTQRAIASPSTASPTDDILSLFSSITSSAPVASSKLATTSFYYVIKQITATHLNHLPNAGRMLCT